MRYSTWTHNSMIFNLYSVVNPITSRITQKPTARPRGPEWSKATVPGRNRVPLRGETPMVFPVGESLNLGAPPSLVDAYCKFVSTPVLQYWPKLGLILSQGHSHQQLIGRPCACGFRCFPRGLRIKLVSGKSPQATEEPLEGRSRSCCRSVC